MTRQGSGPVVILIHGIATSSVSWQAVVPLLSSKFTVITIDLLGFGQSPKPDWKHYTIEEHVASIERTINRLGLGEPFILAGHSLGSLLACRYAAEHPSKVKQLIMVSPPIYLSAAEGGAAEKLATDVYMRAYKYLRSHKDFTMRNAAFVNKLLPGDTMLNITEENWLAFTRSLENCIESQTVLNDIRSVQSPINVVYGALDEFVIDRSMKRLALLPNVSIKRVNSSAHVIGKPLARAIAMVIENKKTLYNKSELT